MIGKLAQINLAPPGGFKGFGPLGLEGKDAGDAPGIFNQVISTTIAIMTAIAFVWFIFQVLSNAYNLINAGGNKEAYETARTKLIHSTGGLIMVVAAVFIIDLIGTLLGIPDILNPGAIIERLGPK